MLDNNHIVRNSVLVNSRGTINRTVIPNRTLIRNSVLVNSRGTINRTVIPNRTLMLNITYIKRRTASISENSLKHDNQRELDNHENITVIEYRNAIDEEIHRKLNIHCEMDRNAG